MLTLETFFSDKDKFVWENCKGNLILMKIVPNYLANSNNSSKIFKSILQRISHIISLNFSNSR